VHRRTLIRWLAGFGVLPWRARPAAAGELELSEAETRTLRAIGVAVLPRSLGREKTDEIVGRFQAWRRGSPSSRLVPPSGSDRSNRPLLDARRPGGRQRERPLSRPCAQRHVKSADSAPVAARGAVVSQSPT
jgi:hypothetical protein